MIETSPPHLSRFEIVLCALPILGIAGYAIGVKDWVDAKFRIDDPERAIDAEILGKKKMAVFLSTHIVYILLVLFALS